ncbi:YdaE family protein [Enterobacter ludwigii]|uniref:YdaE family protein n=1 Tax=Enterobacter ludwigii TaxID=299767 RepID=UPI003BEF10F3
MTVKCAYHLCQKEVDEDKAVDSVLSWYCGNHFRKDPKKYCSEQCAYNDQCAHDM